MSTDTAWMLTTYGDAQQIDAGDRTLREAICEALGTDLIGFVEIVSGVGLWTSLVADVDEMPLNAAALGFIYTLLRGTAITTLPVIHGDAVIGSVDWFGEPGNVGPVGMRALQANFHQAA